MTLEFIQISDTHLCDEHPSRLADLERCVAAISSESTQPGLLIHTGDITHNGLASEYVSAMQAMSAAGLPVFVMPGNRDNRQVMLEFYRDAGPVAAGSQFFHYSIEDFGTRILVLDTHNESTHKGELCDERFDFLERMLAVEDTRPVVIAMHHAPFEATEIPDPFQFTDWAQVDRFRRIVNQNDKIIKVICGHVHRNIDSSFGDIPVQALTCLAGDLRKGTVTDEERLQPVFRWHRC